MLSQGFVSMQMMFCGLHISGYWWFAMSFLGGVALLVRFKPLAHLLPASPRTTHPRELWFYFCIVAAGCLACWVVLSAIKIPTADFDGLAIWSLRLKALIRDRTLYSVTLHDPLSLTPMLRHPYLLPMVQLPYCLAVGSAADTAAHVPQIAWYFCYLALAFSSARLQPTWNSRAIMAVTVALIPAIAIGLNLESSSEREPMMGILGLASVFYLSRWNTTRVRGFLWLAFAFAFAMQQIKVEGSAFLVGLIAGAVIMGLNSSRDKSNMRDVAVGIAALILAALPWEIVRRHIPLSTRDMNYTAGAVTHFGERLRAIPPVARVLGSELFFRPESYAFSPHAALFGLIAGWNRTVARIRVSLLLAPALCLAAICAIYCIRQETLPPAYNRSFSRRMLVLMPALVFACIYRPREQADEENADHLTKD